MVRNSVNVQDVAASVISFVNTNRSNAYPSHHLKYREHYVIKSKATEIGFIDTCMFHHHNHVPEGLGVFPVP